jgi:hypothetical protein
MAFIRNRSTLPSTGNSQPTMLRKRFFRWDCQNSSFSPPFHCGLVIRATSIL